MTIQPILASGWDRPVGDWSLFLHPAHLCFLNLLFLFSCWYKTLRNYLGFANFFGMMFEIWILSDSIFSFQSLYLTVSFLPPTPSPFSFSPLGEHVAGRRAASFCPLNLESSKKKQASYGGKKPENSSVSSLNFYGVKSEGLYVLKMYKRSNFNTWLTSNVTSYIKRGHLPTRPFLPALPFTAPPPTPAPPPMQPRWTARQSLCLDFQGLQSIWGRGMLAQCQGLSKSDRAQSGREEIRWTDPKKLHPGPQTVTRFRESKISFLPPVQWGQCFSRLASRVDHLTLMCAR